MHYDHAPLLRIHPPDKSIIISHLSGMTSTSMPTTPINHVLGHQIPVDSPVCIAGWVRSLRTSKGGFSFISLHDGSSFDGLQVVADDSLDNYADLIRLSAG